MKHLSAVERHWASFVTDRPAPTPDVDGANIDGANPPPEVQEYADGFRMLDDESLAGLLAAYDDVAASTDTMVETVDLDARQPLPEAPWFEPGSTWSVRRVLTHLVAETAQPATPTSSARPSTVSGRWAERRSS